MCKADALAVLQDYRSSDLSFEESFYNSFKHIVKGMDYMDRWAMLESWAELKTVSCSSDSGGSSRSHGSSGCCRGGGGSSSSSKRDVADPQRWLRSLNGGLFSLVTPRRLAAKRATGRV